MFHPLLLAGECREMDVSQASRPPRRGAFDNVEVVVHEVKATGK